MAWGRLGSGTTNLDIFSDCLKKWELVEARHQDWIGLQNAAVMYGLQMVMLGIAEASEASETWNRVNLWGYVSDALFRGIPSTNHGR